MQLFRLMGMPDKLIAFDELPESLLVGLEMRIPEGLPRHWRSWIGNRKKTTKIRPERDAITGQLRVFNDIVEEGPYCFMIDETINSDVERWEEITSYVRRNAPRDFRLKDKIEDMAVKMAQDIRSELKLEPEEVPIIPLSKEAEAEDIKPVVVVKATESKSTEADRVAMQNNAHFKTVSETDVKNLKHAEDCKTLGRAGRYSDGCLKCEALKLKRQTVAA